MEVIKLKDIFERKNLEALAIMQRENEDFSNLDKNKNSKQEFEKFGNEVNKFTINDCIDLLEHYTNEKGKNSNFDKLEKNIKEMTKDKLLKLLKEKGESFQLKDREERRRAFKCLKLGIEDIKKVAPKFSQIINEPPRTRDLDDVKAYLWSRGYEIKRFLGRGGFGTVWECIGKKPTSIAIKVMNKIATRGFTASEGDILKELKNISDLNKIFSLNPELKKRLMDVRLSKHGSNVSTMEILKSTLADGELEVKFDKKNKSKPSQTIDEVVKHARQAIKAVKALHDAGYSHNDIKPENYLLVKKPNQPEKLEKQLAFKSIQRALNNSSKDSEKIKNIKQIFKDNEKLKFKEVQSILNNDNFNDTDKLNQIKATLVNRTQLKLTDFGTITSLKDKTWCPLGGIDFNPHTNIEKVEDLEEVEKRDVFALGQTILEILCKVNASAEHFIKKDFDNKSDLSKPKSYENKRDKSILDLYNCYGKTSEERLKKLLELIRKMKEKDYKKRISIEEALKEIQSL